MVDSQSPLSKYLSMMSGAYCSSSFDFDTRTLSLAYANAVVFIFTVMLRSSLGTMITLPRIVTLETALDNTLNQEVSP